MRRYHLPLLLVFILFTGLHAFAGKVEKKLRKKIPGIRIEKVEPDSRAHFSDAYVIMLTQPIDHKNPKVGTFEQRIWLSHYNFKAPTVMITEGYTGRGRTRELSHLLQANQITVEFRYFGESVPEEMDWQYLSNVQATDDLHRVYELFSVLYKGPWLSSGTSKGGQTTLFYKAAYPNDMKAWVPYVAPMPIAQEDRRTDQHLQTVGTQECRDKLFAFQRRCLEMREDMMKFSEEEAEKQKWTFEMGLEAAFEYAVLEYTFSFWQYGSDCDKIPGPEASAKEHFDHLNEVVGYSLYCDSGVEYFHPAFYLFWRENGYYGFYTDPVKDLLKVAKNPSNGIFAPQDTDISYKPEYMKGVLSFLEKSGNNVLYIYGGIDTWTACGVEPSSNTNAVRFTLPDGPHQTRIRNFPEEDRKQIFSILENWMGTPVGVPEQE